MFLRKALGAFAASLVLSAGFGAQNALAQEWKHASATAVENVSLSLDYTTIKDPYTGCYRCTVYTRTEALWINLRSADFSGSESVRAVLVNKRFAPWTSPAVTDIETREIDLTFAGVENGIGRFTADAGSVRTWGAFPGVWEDFELEIAIVVNGHWLQDPATQTSNFRFALSEK